MKPFSFLIIAAVLVVAALVAVMTLPVAGLARYWLPAEFAVLEGSRLISGRMLQTVGGRSEQVHWRWCPASGPITFCAGMQGAGGHFKALASPAWQGLKLRDIRFQAVPLAALAPDLPLQGRLSGSISKITLTRTGCHLQSLLTAEGVATASDLVMGRRSLPDHRLQWLPAEAGQKEARLQVEGDGVTGVLALNGDHRLKGRLQLDPDVKGLPAQASAGSSLEINFLLPCAGAVSTSR